MVEEISESSEPEMRFYIMVAVSTMIACFVLIAASTAVIIGAILAAAPLMRTIVATVLALIHSDAALLDKALDRQDRAPACHER